MNRASAVERSEALSGAAVGLAVLGTATGMNRLIASNTFPINAGLTVIGMALLGITVRLLLRCGRRVVGFLLQLALAVGIVLPPILGVLPAGQGRKFFEQLGNDLIQGTAPLAPTPAIRWVMLTLVVVFFLLTELIVRIGRAPGWAIVPLGAWYFIYTVLPSPQASVLTLILTLTGYGLILLAESASEAACWRRAITRDTGTGSDALLTVGRLGMTVGIPVVIGALVIGQLLPLFPEMNVGTTDEQVKVADPRVDLRQNLHAAVRREFYQYRSNTPSGTYFTMAVLSTLSDQGQWVAPSQLSLIHLHGQEEYRRPPGLSHEPTRTRETSVTMGNFTSNYLPLPYAPRKLVVEKMWGYDPATLTTIAIGEASKGNDATNYLTYQVTSYDIEPTEDALASATVTGAPREAYDMPGNFPQEIKDLTTAVTAKATTALDKASAIQSFLRSDLFTYDLDGAPRDEGYGGLAEFLMRSRHGYCEQFAGSMAAMARAAGLPSRIVIGFLPGHQRPGGNYSVANVDHHAWVEIWFDGYGWLRFEPTPGVADNVPSYTSKVEVSTQQPIPTPTPSMSVQPSSAAPAPKATPAPEPSPPSPWSDLAPLGWTLLGLSIMTLLVCLPMFIRGQVRRHRLSAGDTPQQRTLGAWRELRATAIDYHIPWPEGSPRAVAAELGKRVDPRARADLEKLALSVERTLYAPSPGETVDTAAIIDTMRAQFAAGIADGRFWLRLGQRLWPRSLLRR